MGCEEPRMELLVTGQRSKASKKNYQIIGSLLNDSGSEPKVGQLYFYNTDHELENRMKHMNNLDRNVVKELLKGLHDSNSYIRSFKAAV